MYSYLDFSFSLVIVSWLNWQYYECFKKIIEEVELSFNYMKPNLDCFVQSRSKQQQKQPIVTQLINYLFTETNERQERMNNALLLTVSRVNHYHYHPFVGLISFIYLVGFVCVISVGR